MSDGDRQIESRLDWLKYHLDFALYPLVFLVVASLDPFLRTAPVAWLVAAGAGAVLWTLAEYWVHRSVLHRFMWQGTHERHHLRPREHVLPPLWYTPGAFAIVFVPLFFASYVMPWTLALFAGVALGYVWFMIMHHLLHHADLSGWTWLQRYAIWHNRHHKLTHCNYGITTNIWDRMFGTYR